MFISVCVSAFAASDDCHFPCCGLTRGRMASRSDQVELETPHMELETPHMALPNRHMVGPRIPSEVRSKDIAFDAPPSRPHFYMASRSDQVELETPHMELETPHMALPNRHMVGPRIPSEVRSKDIAFDAPPSRPHF
ncbi:hypothetical protein BJV77DRAFT_286045 [Russula vinacea]|nr:hypothetical protein BJV77DRAFT_286045 [Russula vinacea]